MKKKVLSVLLAVALILSFGLMAAPAVAEVNDVVFSNYSEITPVPDEDYDAWNDTSPFPNVIEEFKTGGRSGGQWEVTDIKLNAYGGGLVGGGSSPTTVRIYTDAAGTSIVPGAEWNIDIDTGMGEDFSFAVTSVTLDANATYGFGLEATSNTAIGWRQTTGDSHVFELTGNYIEAPNATVTAETEVLADVIAISITPTELPFGPVYRGQSSEAIGMEIINTGTVSVDVSTSTDSLFYQAALTIDGISVGTWSDTIAFPGSIFPKAQVNVPSDWPAGMESGTIIFWAEATQ